MWQCLHFVGTPTEQTNKHKLYFGHYLKLTKLIINTYVCGRFHVQGTLLPKFTFPHNIETINCVILIQFNFYRIFEAQRD